MVDINQDTDTVVDTAVAVAIMDTGMLIVPGIYDTLNNVGRMGEKIEEKSQAAHVFDTISPSFFTEVAVDLEDQVSVDQDSVVQAMVVMVVMVAMVEAATVVDSIITDIKMRTRTTTAIMAAAVAATAHMDPDHSFKLIKYKKRL